MRSIVNIAGYKFTALENLSVLRSTLSELCKAQHLRGTILLSPEGINLFVAGERAGIRSLLRQIRSIQSLSDIPIKESFSDDIPFSRMLVKIKREIIAFGVPGIDPRRYTSRRLAPRDLKRWLDEGKSITLLDTRNRFEAEAGTFESAITIPIDDFRDFPEAVRNLPGELKRQTIVTFCTGGIRCEKAAPYLEREGFTDVYQLDGGILKYFEDCGGANFKGSCFVFDKRVALSASLEESGLGQCFVCQAILSPSDRLSEKFIEGRSCPNCHLSCSEEHAERLKQRHAALRKATTPLPGSVPFSNIRPISVPLRFDRTEVLDFLDGMRTYLSREEWRQACIEGRLMCRGEAVRPGRIVRSGERLLVHMPTTSEPEVARGIEILFEDDAIVVVNKPAPLPMHPCGRFNRNTLTGILNQVYYPLHLRPAHRLDADTSGVVVFSKTRDIARVVQPQFEEGTVRKAYIARVLGHPSDDVFECHWPISREPVADGARLPTEDGAPAATRFEQLQAFNDGTTLLRVEPLTGRTNQIRAHLWKLGLPISGDPIYLAEGQIGPAQTLSVNDPPLCLHAAEIEFKHPRTGETVKYQSAAPLWSAGRAKRMI
jgi:UPF0176 protein